MTLQPIANDGGPMTVGGLLNQAIAIARDIASDALGVGSVVVGLPTDGEPILVFIESDGAEASSLVIDEAVDAMMTEHGVGRWVSVIDAGGGVFTCTACD